MDYAEFIRLLLLVLSVALVTVYPFAVMGPGRPRHTWWAVAMGEVTYVGVAASMVIRLHEPITWRIYLFLFGAISGLIFSYLSWVIYFRGGGRAR